MISGRRAEGETIETKDINILTRGLGGLIPRSVAKRAVSISVKTDCKQYESGEPVKITIQIRNRIPFPIEVVTSGRRIWGWRVDGLLEASDEKLHEASEPRSFSMQARESRTLQREWDGRFKRDGTPTRWEPADRGEHEITAFLATDPPKSDSTVIELR